MKKLMAVVLCLAMVLCLGACAGKAPADPWKTAKYTEDADLGQGAASFDFKVTAGDKSVTFHISTDKKTVGEALQELELVQGEKGEYGLMVSAVDGMSADYDADGFYWAFYVGEEYASKGIDQTEIEAGTEYAMVRTAAQ